MLALIHSSPFYELTALLALAAALGFAGLLLRQPMIVCFIAVGLLAGPGALNIVQAHENIELLADLGVAVLLFVVGLKLDLSLIRTLGGVALATGLGQIFFTTLLGFLLCLGLGQAPLPALYIGLALAFSSTIIVVKLLSDRRAADSLHGRIALGMLIVQDLVVVAVMMALSASGLGAAGDAAGVFLYGVALLAALGLFIRFLATPLLHRLAHSSDLLVTFAIAWAALLAAAGHHFGFGKELGGLLAGVSLASTPFREAIVARLASLRDFLLLFFFIALGARLDLHQLGAEAVPATVLSLFVLIGDPLVVMAVMGLMGYRKRTSFLAGLTMAQVSEFSLIFMALGVKLGHVPPAALGLVTLVALVTIALSVYLITYASALYRWLEPALGLFERRQPARGDDAALPETPCTAILFGIGRYGTAIAENLRRAGFRLLLVDFDPDVVRHWRARGHAAVYGDACDHEFIASLPLKGARWVVSAMPQHDVGLTHEDPRTVLIKGLRQQPHFTGRIAVATQTPADLAFLQAQGADMVFLPYQDAADEAARRMLEST